MRLRGLVALAAAAAFVLAPAGAPSGSANPELMAMVGPSFFIRMTNPDGSLVTRIDPGTYDIVVRDRDVEHNFHLSGPGVDRFTQVEELESVTWTVTFVEGCTQDIIRFIQDEAPPVCVGATACFTDSRRALR